MQSIGERLEEARKRKGISIREAAEATKIRSDYLHKFESNQYDIKLPEIYIRGFLRTYANYLKVPADKVINDYNGLGLGDNKGQRSINREVYGRMDLSVGSKADKDAKEPAATAVAEPAASAEAAFKNPATFIPRPASGGLTIAPDILIKGGILVGIIVIVVLLSVWLFSGRGSNPAGRAASAADQTWVRPLAGEPVLVLVAEAPVSVTVTTRSNNTILFQGTIPRGDRRQIPRRGELGVVADPYQNLSVEIGGKLWPMIGRESRINAP